MEGLPLCALCPRPCPDRLDPPLGHGGGVQGWRGAVAALGAGGGEGK